MGDILVQILSTYIKHNLFKTHSKYLASFPCHFWKYCSTQPTVAKITKTMLSEKKEHLVTKPVFLRKLNVGAEFRESKTCPHQQLCLGGYIHTPSLVAWILECPCFVLLHSHTATKPLFACSLSFMGSVCVQRRVQVIGCTAIH